MARGSEEQRFDFGVLADDESLPARRHETPEELIARVEAVHKRASRTRSRGRQVAAVADEYLAAYPLDELAPSQATTTAIDGPPPPAEARPQEWRGEPELRPGSVVVDDVADDDAGQEQSLTIAGFYERVRRALAAEFSDEVWVTGEIRGFKESRGHRYLELADAGTEPSGGRGAAQQLEVVCWARAWPEIGRQLSEAGIELEVGRVVRVRGKVSVWEGGSKLRFTLTALDVEALLGGIAAARRRLLLALEVEGLLDRNRQRPVPLVPLRIGLVTSPGSEGYRDFVGQLDRSGFAFDLVFEPSLVQGAGAPGQILAALGRLQTAEPDLVVIVRGGGARGDLAAFDSEEVARAIALAPFAVWAGIGHTGDHSVADEVVHSAWITPTACGEAVVNRVAAYWEEIEQGARVLAELARARVATVLERLESAQHRMARSARHQIERRAAEIVGARSSVARSASAELRRERERNARRGETIHSAAGRALSGDSANLERRSQVLAAYDPKRQFARGWSLVHHDGVLVRSAGELSDGDVIVARFTDGQAGATVTSVDDARGSSPRTPTKDESPT